MVTLKPPFGRMCFTFFQTPASTSKPFPKKELSSGPVIFAELLAFQKCMCPQTSSKSTWSLVVALHFPGHIGYVHPKKLAWSLKTAPWKRRNIYKPPIFGFQPLFFGGVRLWSIDTLNPIGKVYAASGFTERKPLAFSLIMERWKKMG